MRTVVGEMERTYLPRLRDAAAELALLHPNCQFKVWSSPIGSATTYQGHSLGLECLLPDAQDWEADSVALCITVRHLTTVPELCEAAVEWGSGAHPSVRIEVIEKPMPATPESFAVVADHIPQLLATLGEALRAWAGRGANA